MIFRKTKIVRRERIYRNPTQKDFQEMVNGAKRIERELAEAREALSSIKGILPTVYSSDREIHEIINKVLKEQGR